MVEQLIAENLVKTYTLKEKTGLFKPKKKKIVEAVKGISLTIPRGKIIGLLGLNGAGKTTTIRMLSAVVEPTSGKLAIDGIDAVKYNMQVKSRINMITGGERNLYWRLTAKENLEYFGCLYGLSGKKLNDRINYLLNMVELTDAANTPVERYSKGMKQRLQIARGLINNPDYLFLDEPTLGLDIMIAKEMRQYIAKLASEHNKGLLLTTHYISEAEELCDYIYVIDKGTIIAAGTKEELKNLFKYSKELVIMANHIPIACIDKIKFSLQLKDSEISFNSNENGTDILHFIGNTTIWVSVLNILKEENVEIINVKSKEPDLEETLLSIIKDFRKIS